MANKSTAAKAQKYPFFSTSLKIETKMFKVSHIVNDLKDALLVSEKTQWIVLIENQSL